MNKQKLTWFVLTVFLLTLTIFSSTTCETPMGMGDSIDFEAPVLTITTVPNPWYVRNGATLTGTVTDNVAVDRVVMTDTSDATGNVLFTAVTSGSSNNKTWEIVMNFNDSDNGRKIVGQITAYDTAGNSGAESIAFVTLIVDTSPPRIESMTIQRTESRMTFFQPLDKLKEYETLDSKGEKKDYVYNYQNGWFYIDGIANDADTKIESISLYIYDVTDPSHINTPLLTLDRIGTSSAYFPRWFIKEDDLIAAGVAQWGQSYKDNYYNGQRYYYRVAIHATDKSNNDVMEEKGYFCMWEKSDDPKGILDPSIGDTVIRGTPLPIDFFDDDSLDWAYAGLLTRDQWNGSKPVATDVKIPDLGGNKEGKLDWLKTKLVDEGLTIYNWKYDKQGTAKGEQIVELLEGKKMDEKLVYIPTGNADTDYGEFVLFTISKDKKLTPHDGKGPENTNKDRWSGIARDIQVIDENAPLIVFDTTEGTGGPEENTFPSLTDGEFFNIVGYTLRENSTNQNSVTTFRMAWIPYGMPGKADDYISDVQKALADKDFAGMPDGVQYWDFVPSTTGGVGKLKDENNITIPETPKPGETTSTYKKQSFKKQFSVLGGEDDVNKKTYNFTYKDVRENATKLFIFYAKDTMGHEVYRQLRLLGITTPPKLVVYDITTRTPEAFSDLPNINSYTITSGDINSKYIEDLNDYNQKQSTMDQLLSDSKIKPNPLEPALGKDQETIPFQIYPRGSRLKYWVIAAEATDIGVDDITMKDVTYKSFDVAPVIGSGYREEDKALSFVEYYPDVTQRIFLFEATDKLGNKASLQRTIAVTNAARLENITTTAQNGTYGPGSGKIEIKANFSSQILLQNGNDVTLNVRYQKDGVSGYQYDALKCTNKVDGNPTLSLDFEFEVKDGYYGNLETVYDNTLFGATGYNAWPIRLNDNTPGATKTKIIDYLRLAEKDNEAFIPGYKSGSVQMPNWTTDVNTLQRNKKITLDGRKPKITSTVVGGKTIASENPDKNYYFKAGETITFTLTADKPINTSVTAPKLSYDIKKSNGDIQTISTEFKYQRPDGPNKIVFELKVETGDGELINVKPDLVSGTSIQDNYGNLLSTDEFNSSSLVPSNAPHVFIKTTPPSAPVATLNGTAISTIANNYFYSTSPTLAIPDSPNKYGTGASAIDWENGGKEYSLTNGSTWLSFTGASASIPDGEHKLKVRYIDKAGNQGATLDKPIRVTSRFPKLTNVNIVQTPGWYTSKAGNNSLTFNLTFEREVSLTATPVTITVTNRSGTLDDIAGGVSPSYQITLQAKSGQTNVKTLQFEWNNILGKEMRDGLYISSVDLEGLEDIDHNKGSTGGANMTNPLISMVANSYCDAYTCTNLPWTTTASVKVDAIAPTYKITPSKGGVLTDTKNKIITLTFEEPVMIGTGTITVKPRDDGGSNRYKIPAVIRNDGYYLGTDGKEYTDPDPDRTFIAGFYDIYNALTGTNATIYRNYLTKGSSMSKLDLNERTGQSAGPYVKMTHGLKEGAGFSGAYSGTDGPSPAKLTDDSYMIPDISTKWVLDFPYSIDNKNNTQYADTSNNLVDMTTANEINVVNNIRTALTAAEWRWQKMSLVSSVSISNDKKTVTITLNEPLLKGLQWEISFLAGTFTDLAGNDAAAVESGYWFWSNGVQDPVIRVNRKSFDARTANWASTTRVYAVPVDRSSPGGWGINDFKTVHYKIETETPDAIIFKGENKGNLTNKGTIIAAWSGDIADGRTWARPDQVNSANNTTNCDWVLSNLVRRSRVTDADGRTEGSNGSYTAYDENGNSVTRIITGWYQGYRSYNRDIKKSDLLSDTATPLTTTSANTYLGSFTYEAMEASKNYVVAYARITHDSDVTYSYSNKGYEGVFRSVIALRQDYFDGNVNGANRSTQAVQVEGSNVKNGMPSIAGFPVYDAGESGDNRFLKLFCYVNASNGSVYTDAPDSNTPTPAGLYWVSTEIVSQWYFLARGNTHAYTGDVNNYLYSGYGDLSYCRNMR